MRTTLTFVGDLFLSSPEPIDNLSSILSTLCKPQNSLLIINFEGSLISSTPRSKSALLPIHPSLFPILSQYPVLVNLANNHITDFGSTGIDYTLQSFRKYAISFTGITKFAELDGSFKFVGFTPFNRPIIIVSLGWSHEDCVPPSVNQFGVLEFNEYNINRLYRHIIELYDNPIVFLYCHAGYEFERYPLPEHVGISRYAIDIGYESVIYSHAHVPQAFEVYKDKHIYYGLGNFFFHSDQITHPSASLEGLSVSIDFCTQTPQYRTTLIRNNHKENSFSFLPDPFIPSIPNSLSFYSAQYPFIRSRFLNPRPILYFKRPISNFLSYKMKYRF